jgi:hypothetical protein
LPRNGFCSVREKGGRNDKGGGPISKKCKGCTLRSECQTSTVGWLS